MNKTNGFVQFDDKVLKKIESLLRALEAEELKYAKLKNNFAKAKISFKRTKEELAKIQKEKKTFNKKIAFLERQISILNKTLEEIRNSYQISAEASVDLLSDLEYSRYKSRFIDIDIKFSPSIDKLKEYSKNIKNFFLNEMHCTFFGIQCNGITEDLQNLLRLNIRKQQRDMASFSFDRNNVYYINLEDSDLKERKLGRIIIGRYPYKSAEKEASFNKRIGTEILFCKRLIEKCILEIQNKELSIKDALTGLHTRKFLIEQLTDEFNHIDIFSKLNETESQLLKIIMKSQGKASSIIMNRYFYKFKTKNEVTFNKALHKLKSLNVISTESVRYFGDWEDCYYFINSKFSYDVYLAVLDLDHFKEVNDNWGGHAVGDRILRDFAGIIKKNIRTTDITVRYGGEEFIIVFLRSNNYPRIFQVLENIRRDCERKLTVTWNGRKRNITVSIGVTQIDKFDMNIHYIINRADTALYKAKKKRNRIVMCMQKNGGELLYK